MTDRSRPDAMPADRRPGPVDDERGDGAFGRRAVLRGLGVGVALPWLESATALGRRAAAATVGTASAAAAPATAPLRMAFCFVPNGVDAATWFPREGAAGALSPALEPLAAVRDRFSIVEGLCHRNARALGDGPGDHARSAAAFLTGAHPVKTAGADIEAGISVDQYAANRIGGRTPLASLELGCEPALTSGNCDSGYSCAYSANISWRTEHQPNLKEIRPRAVFERLFQLGPARESAQARVKRIAARRSILDLVRGDARRLERDLGGADRRRMEEYLDGVRALERRIESVERAGDDPDRIAEGDIRRELPDGMPGDYREHVELMNDLLVLAFRTDRTRIATFMLANEGSNRPYPFLDVREGHHHLSHHAGDEHMIDRIRRINRWQSEAYRDLIERMDAVDEGGGSLLDHTMLVFGSAIRDGNRHDHDDLPVLLAGGSAAGLRPGRRVQAAPGTPMCDLYVSMLQRMGVATERFGDSRGALAGI